jgi:hypothetical protein
MEATLHAAGVRTGYVQRLGLLVSAGRDRLERQRPDATTIDAPFEGATGMQDPCCCVRPKRRTLIASARFDRYLSRPPDGSVS